MMMKASGRDVPPRWEAVDLAGSDVAAMVSQLREAARRLGKRLKP
jgi:hypothetical protein